LPCFSSTGPDVELAAPGVSILSTVPGGGYASYNGTSMASPHVAGAAALLISAGVPDTSGNGRVNDEVRTILTSTAIDLGSSGRDTQFGFGLVDVVAALAALGPGGPATDAVNVSLATDKATYVQGTDATVTLTALVSDENGQPITGLNDSDFAVLLDNAPVALVTTWGPTANPGQYTAAISLPTAGTHTVQVTADDGSAVGTDSASFNVQAAGGGSVTVQSVTWGGSGGKNNDKHLLVTVTIVDGNDQPIANASAAIDVTRDGNAYASSVGTTGSNGQATFQLTNPPSGCYAVRVTTVTVGGDMSVLNVDAAGPCKQ